MAENGPYDKDADDFASRHNATPDSDPDSDDSLDPEDIEEQEASGAKKSGEGAQPAGGGKSGEGSGSPGGKTGEGGGSPKEEKKDEDDDFSFNPNDPSHRGSLRNVLGVGKGGKRRKVLAIAFGSGLSIVGIATTLIFILLPLKIENIMNSLDQRFGATTQDAVENETEKLLSGYIKKSIIPALTQCGSTVSKDCNPRVGTGNDPITSLYRGWKDARLENKLADNYGIEFKAHKIGAHTKYYMMAPGLNADGEDISSFVGDDGNLFQEVSRGEARTRMRQEVHTAMANETRWKKVLTRYKVGKLMEEKYGVKRCIVYCDKRDNVKEFKDKKVNVASVFLVQRVIGPHSESMAIVFECMFTPSCNPIDTSPQPADGDNSENSGGPESDVEVKNREAMRTVAGRFNITNDDDIDRLVRDRNTIREKGYSVFIVNKALTKVGLSELSDNITDKLPVLNWIEGANTVIQFFKKAGPALKKLSYVANIGAAIQVYDMYRSYSDEVHTGGVDPSQLGDMTASLGEGNQSDGSDPEVGGTASAEETPLYAYLNQNNDQTGGQTASLVDQLLPSKAYAASKKVTTKVTKKYKCNDGNPVPTGKLLCAEENFGKGNTTLSNVSSFLNQGFVGTLTGAFGWLASVPGKIAQNLPFAGFFNNLITNFPGVKQVSELTAKVVTPFFQGALQKVIPDPFGSNMSGGRKYDMIAAGSKGIWMDSAQHILGGHKLTSKNVAEITNRQLDQARDQFNQRPFFARMFSTNTQYSLISRLAMSVPLNIRSTAGVRFAGVIGKPINLLGTGFASIFAKPAAAEDTPDGSDCDLFGITCYGYTLDDLQAIGDSTEYWTTHCSDNASQAYQSDADFQAASWNQDAANNPDIGSDGNGMPVNTKTNPCMLIKASAQSAGAAFDTNMLSEDEQTTINGGQGGGASGDTTTTTASTDVNLGDIYKDSSKVACAAHTKDLGVQDGYTGGNKVKIRICAVSNLNSSGEESSGGYGVSGADGKAVVNSRVSGAFYAMEEAAKADGVDLSGAVSSAFRTMAHQNALCPCDGVNVAHPGYSNHQMGIAVDFGGVLPQSPGPIAGNKYWDWLSKNASKFGLKNYPHEAWHWSPTGS